VKDTARALIFRAGRRPPKDLRHDRAGRWAGVKHEGGVMVLVARLLPISDQFQRRTTFTPRLKVVTILTLKLVYLVKSYESS
jgi:hypothetical protein